MKSIPQKYSVVLRKPFGFIPSGSESLVEELNDFPPESWGFFLLVLIRVDEATPVRFYFFYEGWNHHCDKGVAR